MPAKPSAKPNTAVTIDTRCKYVAASGRRCKSPAARDTSRASGYSAFCLPHSQMEQQYLDAESVAKKFIGPVDDFRTNLAVNDVLGRLLVLVAENRIPLRNASALAYICQLLLASNTGVRYELNLRGGLEGELFVVNRTIDIMYGENEDDEDDDDEEERTKETNDANSKPATQ